MQKKILKDLRTQMIIMDEIKNDILAFKNYIGTNIKQQLVHNHVPVKGLVNGCNYCELFGNVFKNGVISANDKEHILCKYLIYKNDFKT